MSFWKASETNKKLNTKKVSNFKRQPEATWSFIKSELRNQRLDTKLDYETRATEGHTVERLRDEKGTR